MTTKVQKPTTEDNNRMANSLKKQTQGDAMNIPPGIDRIITKTGDCRYRVRIRIKGHPPISKNFKSLNHAKQWKRVTEGQIEKGLYVSFSKADQYTVADAIQRYLKEVLPKKTKDSKNIERHLCRWEKELGHLRLSRLNQSTIAEVRDRLLSESITSEKTRSGATVKRYLSSFSHVLSMAVREWQWLNENPCLKVTKPRESSGRVRYLSNSELARLIQACKQSENTNLYLIFLIALTTGARRSEILGLRSQDIDFENRLFYLADTKNRDNRSVPMSNDVFFLLKGRSSEHGHLLFSSTNNPFKPCCFRSAWKNALKKAGIRDFRFHDIRHTMASYLTMEGASTREVAEMLGHKTLQMTKRYSHLSHEHKRKLVTHLEEIIHERAE